MNIKKFIIVLKIAFLLTLFGGATFYFQYVPVRKIAETSKDKCKSASCSQPMSEEETEGQTSSEEEEQIEVRALHQLKLALFEVSFSAISWATVHHFSFEEIHFEVITPPPQA